MKFISDRRVETGRELSDLDIFALDFVRILRMHTDYVIVSGYVSILLGRARASEDIDIIIPRMDAREFRSLLDDIGNAGFYCLNAEDGDIFEQIGSNLPVRFARQNTVIPNIELKYAKNRIDEISLESKILVRLGKEELNISNLEMQIAFKEEVLKSPKDMEDARHIRNIAKDHLKPELIKDYRRMLHEVYGRE